MVRAWPGSSAYSYATMAISRRVVDAGMGRTERYDRHHRLEGFGVAGQRRLGAARALIVGLGGLGGPAALHLAAAGVGHITLSDHDRVDATNLHRQIQYGEADVGQSKLEATAAALRQRRGDLSIALAGPVGADATDLVRGHDVVIDGADNHDAHYALSDTCLALGIPLVQGGLQGYDGHVLTIPPGGPCLRCLHPAAPPSIACADVGVLGPMAGVLGSMLATHAVRGLALQRWQSGLVQLYDGLEGRWETLRFQARCAACRDSRVPGGEPAAAATSGQAAMAPAVWSLDAAELRARQASGEALVLLDVRRAEEAAGGQIAGSRLVPLEQVATMPDLPTNAAVVVYCQSGFRSLRAAAILRRRGVPALNLRGGFDAWRRSADSSQEP
jgi:sulfur-carrier protein adenylyltransferase/sulfurtransferase